MIILRQKNYSTGADKFLHGVVGVRNKVNDATAKVSHAVRKALTKDGLERQKLDLMYRPQKRSSYGQLVDTVNTKQKIKNAARSAVQKTSYLANGIISPGEAVSEAGGFVAKHPSSLLAATCIPVPGAAETWAAVLDNPLQDTIPAYKNAAEKVSTAYQTHGKHRVRRAVDGIFGMAKHIASAG